MFKRLDDIAIDDKPHIGGKAYNCARLKQAGFPVPDGLALPADAGEDAIAALGDEPWLRSLPADTLFAVRSSGLAEDSAEDSFAGVHATELNVRRDSLV